MEIGIYTFAERTPDHQTGELVSAEHRLRDLLEEIELADQLGLDVFGIGEHHRPDYVVSSPAVVLAAAAARTKQIRLTSAVTVLSSDDPVRVFQDFATLDLLSGGRAEIMAGRGSFIESFPLFGYELDDYDTLFAEKLDLLLRLRESERVEWEGEHRPAIGGLGVYPRPVQESIPIWIAVGGTPQSVVRAATLGLPLALAIIGGAPERFVPMVDLYRETARRAGRDPATLPVSINSHGFIADTSEQAADDAWLPYATMMGRIGRERGWPPPTRQRFDAERSPRGALLVGDPQEVIDKILFEHELFDNQRFLMQMSVGTMAHAKIMRSIELLGTVVAPAVRRALGLVLLVFAVLGCSEDGPTATREFPGTSVLFIGNSLTGANSLALMVRSIAAAGGFEISGGQVVLNNYSLVDHLNRGDAAAAIEDVNWDYVVLQQGPSGLPESRVALVESAQAFDELITEAGATPALYMVWPDASRMTAFDSVSASYTAAADAIGGLLFPAGDAWVRAWEKDATLQLYAGDNFHPSALGSYLAALTIYAVLCNQDPLDLPLRPAGISGTTFATVTDAQLRLLQEAASEVTADLARKGSCAPLD